MSTARKRVKTELTAVIDNLEWAVTHMKRVHEAFDSYTQELVKLANDPALITDESLLERYLGHTLISKELEESFAQLIIIVQRLQSEI